MIIFAASRYLLLLLLIPFFFVAEAVLGRLRKNRVRAMGDETLVEALCVDKTTVAHHLARLEENPFQFPVDLEIDLPGRTYRKAIFAKWFKVLFQVKDQRVYIDGIIDCRRDPAAIDF